MNFLWPRYSRHTWQVTHDNIHSSDCVLGDFPGVTLQCLLQTKQTDLLDPLHCDVKDPILALPRQGDFQLHLVTEREGQGRERDMTDYRPPQWPPAQSYHYSYSAQNKAAAKQQGFPLTK